MILIIIYKGIHAYRKSIIYRYNVYDHNYSSVRDVSEVLSVSEVMFMNVHLSDVS